MSDDLVKRLRQPTGVNAVTQEPVQDKLNMAAADRIEELEAVLKKLEYWFDTDQKILDVMRNNEKADHMRKLKLIRDTLTGDNDD